MEKYGFSPLPHTGGSWFKATVDNRTIHTTANNNNNRIDFETQHEILPH